MASISKNQTPVPIPPALWPFARAAQANLLVFAIAFYIAFSYFRSGKISGLSFGAIVALLLAVYLAIGQGLRIAVRKRRGGMTAIETSEVIRHGIDLFSKQKRRAIIRLCFFAFGAITTGAWAFLHRQFGEVLLIPAALLAIGLFNVWSVNRAMKQLESKQEQETVGITER